MTAGVAGAVEELGQRPLCRCDTSLSATHVGRDEGRSDLLVEGRSQPKAFTRQSACRGRKVIRAESGCASPVASGSA